MDESIWTSQMAWQGRSACVGQGACSRVERPATRRLPFERWHGMGHCGWSSARGSARRLILSVPKGDLACGTLQIADATSNLALALISPVRRIASSTVRRGHKLVVNSCWSSRGPSWLRLTDNGNCVMQALDEWPDLLWRGWRSP